jgi:hypothetical protein
LLGLLFEPLAVQAADIARCEQRRLHLPCLNQVEAFSPRGHRAARETAMTTLERALSSILELIEKARVAGNSLALDTLMQRKDAICAALAAPEQH